MYFHSVVSISKSKSFLVTEIFKSMSNFLLESGSQINFSLLSNYLSLLLLLIYVYSGEIFCI